jgi:glucose 1-dehydrogenase
MSQPFAGKVALVTGGNRGIGKGCALELARRGADVCLNYRGHAEEAEEVARQVRALGRRALVFQADVAERAACRAMVERTVAEFGRLDVVVANAAYSIRKPFLEMEEEDMAATFAVTLWGAFHVAQFGARQMARQCEGGSIVFISSVHAVVPVPNSVAYNISKAGMNQMARTMAAELARLRIRVNVVEPGWTDTPGERAFATEEELQAGGKRMPLGRLATIEDIAYGVAYLASPEADYVTGTVLRIDGGFVVRSNH